MLNVNKKLLMAIANSDNKNQNLEKNEKVENNPQKYRICSVR